MIIVMKHAEVKFIIGLGNAKRRYGRTYHNVGHLFADFVREKFMVLKNSGFMNEAGGFAAKTLKKSGAKPAELLVAHDDSDLLLGTYKLQFGRGAAGHKGVSSIIASLHTKNFWRLRIGIRVNPRRDQRESAYRLKAEEFVLKPVSAAHKKILEEVFARAAEELVANIRI